MNIWIKKYAVLVFVVGMGSTVFTMEKPAKTADSTKSAKIVATQESTTPDFIPENSQIMPASPNLRRPMGARPKRHSITNSGNASPDLRGSQDSDRSGDDTYKIPAMPTPKDVADGLRYLGCACTILDRTEIHEKYYERTDIPGQQKYMEEEPIARKFRDILLLVFYKKQCGVEFYQQLTIKHLEKIQSNQEMYDEAFGLLALVAD